MPTTPFPKPDPDDSAHNAFVQDWLAKWSEKHLNDGDPEWDVFEGVTEIIQETYSEHPSRVTITRDDGHEFGPVFCDQSASKSTLRSGAKTPWRFTERWTNRAGAMEVAIHRHPTEAAAVAARDALAVGRLDMVDADPDRVASP